MDARLVDPRDIGWEVHAPVYRVSFRRGNVATEYELTGAADVDEVLAWAREHAEGRGYTVAALVDRGHPAERGLVELAAVGQPERPCR